MAPDLLASLRRLSDADLEGRVRELAARERGATALLVAHLAELDTREVHYRAGHGSLFAYCREVLGLAEQEAYNRIAVARTARRFPVILELLESGALSLTTARILGPHLTSANHASVLAAARGKSKTQVEELAAALWPRPDAPTFVRKLPSPHPLSCSPMTASTSASPFSAGPRSSPWAEPAPASLTSPPPSSSPAGDSSPSPHFPLPAPAAPAQLPDRRSAEITPLSPDRYRVQVTIGGETLEKLRLAKDLLRHSLPSGDEAVILDRALTVLLDDLARRKFSATANPRPAAAGPAPPPGSRRIPAEVRRKVWLRDHGRCAFVGTGGRRCGERAFLEFHHLKPHALGGEATVDNIELRCRGHNAHEARLYFDPGNGNGGAGVVREGARHGQGEWSGTRSGTSRPIGRPSERDSRRPPGGEPSDRAP